MEYDVICSESIDKLVEYVNVYASFGWQTYCPLFSGFIDNRAKA